MSTEETDDDMHWMSGLATRFSSPGSIQRLRALFAKIAEASVYDPGEADLDDSQPVTAHLNLGDVRMARRLSR